MRGGLLCWGTEKPAFSFDFRRESIPMPRRPGDISSRIPKYVERVVRCEGIPPYWSAEPTGNEIIVQVSERGPEQASFRCPCGCGDWTVLQLVNEKRQRPHGNAVWDYKTGGHLVHPSVNCTSGCRSHYWINLDGTVVWA